MFVGVLDNKNTRTHAHVAKEIYRQNILQLQATYSATLLHSATRHYIPLNAPSSQPFAQKLTHCLSLTPSTHYTPVTHWLANTCLPIFIQCTDQYDEQRASGLPPRHQSAWSVPRPAKRRPAQSHQRSYSSSWTACVQKEGCITTHTHAHARTNSLKHGMRTCIQC